MTGVTPRVKLLSLPVSFERKGLEKETENWPVVRFATTVLTFDISFLSVNIGFLVVSNAMSKHVKESFALPKYKN